jgi:hypothetical protein
MADTSSQVEPTVLTSTSTSSSPDTATSPTLRRGSRQAPPSGLDLGPISNDNDNDNNTSNLIPPTSSRQDFPSPGTAPAGQRIFDANAVAEDKGVETVTGGWAGGTKEQEKLEEEYEKQDETSSSSSPTGLKQKVKDLLHRD